MLTPRFGAIQVQRVYDNANHLNLAIKLTDGDKEKYSAICSPLSGQTHLNLDPSGTFSMIKPKPIIHMTGAYTPDEFRQGMALIDALPVEDESIKKRLKAGLVGHLFSVFSAAMKRAKGGTGSDNTGAMNALVTAWESFLNPKRPGLPNDSGSGI